MQRLQCLSRSAAERYCWLRHWSGEVFDETGHAADLCQDAISLVPTGPSVAGTYHGNLRVALLSQFSRTDDGDWNHAIDEQQHTVDQFQTIYVTTHCYSPRWLPY
jgi:hypothetical protein